MWLMALSLCSTVQQFWQIGGLRNLTIRLCTFTEADKDDVDRTLEPILTGVAKNLPMLKASSPPFQIAATYQHITI